MVSDRFLTVGVGIYNARDICKERRLKDPFDNGLKLEISVWTHVYLNKLNSYIQKYL